MPLNDRDYVKGRHPPTCTCTECVKRRLERIRKRERFTPQFASGGKVDHRFVSHRATPTKKSTYVKQTFRKTPNWLLALLLILAFLIIGFGLSVLTKSAIPFYVLLGLSVLYIARKHILPTILLALILLAVTSTISMVWPQGITKVTPKQLEILHILPTRVDAQVIEQSIYLIINEERQKAGLTPLLWDDELAEYAKKHNTDMVRVGSLYHDKAELAQLQAGENALMISKYCGGFILLPYPIGLAFYRSDRELCNESVKSWMESLGHRLNILTSGYKYTGIGVAVAEDGITCYITQDFR